MVSTWQGPPAMKSLFTRMFCCKSCPNIVKTNNFINFQSYFLQKVHQRNKTPWQAHTTYSRQTKETNLKYHLRHGQYLLSLAQIYQYWVLYWLIEKHFSTEILQIWFKICEQWFVFLYLGFLSNSPDKLIWTTKCKSPHTNSSINWALLRRSCASLKHTVKLRYEIVFLHLFCRGIKSW